MSLPLSGLGVLITRPLGQAAGLRARLEAQGARAVLFPTLEIQPPADPTGLARQLARLAQYDFAVFISPTAVEQAFARIAAWPEGVRVACVGQGTAAALREAGITAVLVPDDGADSEHLLALPELADMRGRGVLILRGEGGRELLATALTERGARVDYAECYRRGLPSADPAALIEDWRHGGIQAVTVLSTQGLDNLFILLGAEHGGLIRATPLFAPHPRIAEHARALGIHHAITTPAGETGLTQALVEYFEHV